MAVETHPQAADVAKLAHRALLPTESVETHAHRDGAVDTAVHVAARCEAGCLEGEHLVRGELLLVEGLLLLLQRLNLGLDGDLVGELVGIRTELSQSERALTCSAMMPEMSPRSSGFLWLSSRFPKLFWVCWGNWNPTSSSLIGGPIARFEAGRLRAPNMKFGASCGRPVGPTTSLCSCCC